MFDSGPDLANLMLTSVGQIQVPTFSSPPKLSCSATLEKKREPFLGKTILVGQPPKKKEKGSH